MKRHIQFPGVRKWAGNDFIDLQSEPLKALDGFFAQYGPCVVQGLDVTPNGSKYNVSEGLVVLTGQNQGGSEVTMVVPFEGVKEVVLPLYLTLACTVKERVYADEKVRPIAYDYRAGYSSVKPEPGVPYFKLLPEGNVRFTDALQDDDHQFISNAERLDWNSKATGDHVHAAATTSKAGFMSAQDKQKVETATNDIADIKSGFITVGKAKVADSVAWANVTGKLDATSSASGLMSGSDKTNLGAAMTDIANLKSGTTPAGKVEWANVANKVNASTSVAGLMTAADKTSLNTAVTDIANLKNGTTAAGKVEWANVANKVNASTSVAGLMTAADKTSLNTAVTDIANLRSGTTTAGKALVADSVAWANVTGKVNATNTDPGLMSSTDKNNLDTAVSNINDLVSGTLYSGALGWLNPSKTDFVANHRVMAVRENASNAETRLYLQYGTTWSNSVSVYAADVAGKVAWENVEDKEVATDQKDGLMSASDKAKLEGINMGAARLVWAGRIYPKSSPYITTEIGSEIIPQLSTVSATSVSFYLPHGVYAVSAVCHNAGGVDAGAVPNIVVNSAFSPEGNLRTILSVSTMLRSGEYGNVTTYVMIFAPN